MRLIKFLSRRVYDSPPVRGYSRGPRGGEIPLKTSSGLILANLYVAQQGLLIDGLDELIVNVLVAWQAQYWPCTGATQVPDRYLIHQLI
jgi:hypothetical protein